MLSTDVLSLCVCVCVCVCLGRYRAPLYSTPSSPVPIPPPKTQTYTWTHTQSDLVLAICACCMSKGNIRWRESSLTDQTSYKSRNTQTHTHKYLFIHTSHELMWTFRAALLLREWITQCCSSIFNHPLWIPHCYVPTSLNPWKKNW